MASITYADKDKESPNVVQRQFRDVDANEIKSVVNQKQDAPTGGKTLVTQCGDWDASGANLFPTNGNGSGAGGAIVKGDQFDISVADAGGVLPAGATVRAKINDPAQVVGNWRIYY